jgi:biopolymer transport protein ExbD
MWDVFHADRLELERGLSGDAIRAALARGEMRDDDLARPAGTAIPWARLADLPELLSPAASAPAPSPLPVHDPEPRPGSEPEPAPQAGQSLRDFEDVQTGLEEIFPPHRQHHPTQLPEPASPSDVSFPVFDIEPEPSPPAQPEQSAPAPPPAWAWDDDDDDDLGDDNDGITPDQDDMEILADESELDDLQTEPGASARIQAKPAVPGAAAVDTSESQPRHSEYNPRTADPDRWERTEEDLDLDRRPESRSSHVALPVVRSRDRDQGVMPGEDGEDEEAFSLSRSATQRIEELDLAPMVDVAFQLVLFFMVTATTVLYKTLELPKPSAETPPSTVAQGRSRSLDDLKEDYILVEIDDRGAMKLDREPIEPVRETLVEQLRQAREKTGRKSMLLSADYATAHRNAVLAYDAAYEIGLLIAIAKPQNPQGPAPTLRGAAPAPRAAAPAPPAAPL